MPCEGGLIMERIRNEEELNKRIEHCSSCLNKKIHCEPGHRAIVVCGGTGCLASESKEFLDRMQELIKEHGLEEKVTANIVGCFGFWSQGPFVKIFPEETLYTKVKLKDAEEIFEKDILNGEIVTRLLYVDPQTKEKVQKQHDINFYKLQMRDIALDGNGVINPEDIDMIIAASTAPIELYSMGCQIHKRLGIKKQIPAFDIAAACTGLIYGLSIAKGLIASGMYKNILIVATDNNSKLLDWTDRGTSILFGDGAGAMVVTQSDDGVDDIISIDIKSDGNYDHLISLRFDGNNCPLVEPNEKHPSLIRMNGRGVYAFVAKILPKYVEELLQNAGVKSEEIDYLIPHQANIRIIQAVQERLGLPEEKVVTNIKYYGNTSAASIPIALAEGVEKGHVKLGSTALLCGFGAGMTWGAAIVRLRKGIC